MNFEDNCYNLVLDLFESYDDYIKALECSLYNENWKVIYPEYFAAKTRCPKIDCKIIYHFMVMGLTPTQGFNIFLKFVIKNAKLMNKFPPLLNILRLFVGNGAKVDAKILFNLDDVSNECIILNSKMIDYLWNHMDIEYVKRICNWRLIPNVPKFKVRNHVNLYGHLKYHSTSLKSLN